MDKELKAKWVAALRGGQFKQGFNNLYDKQTDSYCCLGVLHVVIKGEAPPRSWFGDRPRAIDPIDHILPKLTDMNDSGSTFAEIADYIEANL